MFFREGFGGFDGFEEHFAGGRPQREKKEVENSKLYEILGVEKKATPGQIKKAYFKLAKLKHPDKGGDLKEFQAISAAYDILKNEDKREIYDKHGMEGIKEGRGVGGGGGGMDMFEQMFGGGGRQRGKPQQKKAKGMVKEVEITMEEAYQGGAKKFHHERYRICHTCDGKGGEGVEKCSPCKGRGIVQKMVQLGPGMYSQTQQHCSKCRGEGITIKKKCSECKAQKIVNKKKIIECTIERGVYEGYDYIMTGEGHEAPDVIAGDLHVRYKIKKHKLFERKGADLHINKKISLLQALTGLEFKIEHLDGKMFNIATQPGEVISHNQMKMIRGQGFPFFGDEMSHGNLFIQFDVEFPKKGQLKPKQMKLLKKILPGPICEEIDYKKQKYDILENYDDFDFNPKPTGESKFLFCSVCLLEKEEAMVMKMTNSISRDSRKFNANNLDLLDFVENYCNQYFNFKTSLEEILMQNLQNSVIDGIQQQELVDSYLISENALNDKSLQMETEEYQNQQQLLDQEYDNVIQQNDQNQQEEENPYVLHIRSLQRSAQYQQNVLKKLDTQIKKANVSSLEQDKLLKQFQKFRKERSKANCREVKKQLKIAKLEVQNYQYQVSEIKTHIKKLTTFERINKLNQRKKQRGFQIKEMSENKDLLLQKNKKSKQKLKTLKKSKEYFSEATHNLNQQYLSLKANKVDKLQQKVREQNRRVENMRQVLKFKQQESKQLLENIIELETTYREICSQNNIKTKNQYLKSPFNKLQGPLTTRTPRLKNKKYLKALENTVKQITKKLPQDIGDVMDLAKGAGLIKGLKSDRTSNQSSRSSKRSLIGQIKGQAQEQLGTFITGTKNFVFDQLDKTHKKTGYGEIKDEKVRYKKEIRDLMSQLKGIYQQQDNIRYNQQSQIRDRKLKIKASEKLIKKLQKEDPTKIKESLENKLESLEKALETKKSQLVYKQEKLETEKEFLIDQQTQNKYTIEQKTQHLAQINKRTQGLMVGIINPEPFLTTKQQLMHNLVQTKTDEYEKIQEGDFDPETFLFSDEKFLGKRTHFRIKEIHIKAFSSYIIWISTTYIDLKTGKEYQQTHRKGDIPEGSETMTITLDDEDKILQIILQKDENNFIRYVEIQTLNQIQKIGGMDNCSKLILSMEHEEQKQIFEMFCLFGAFQSLIKKGLNQNLVVLTGLGMCLKKNLEIEEKIFNDMIVRTLDEVLFGNELVALIEGKDEIHWSRDPTVCENYEDILTMVHEMGDKAAEDGQEVLDKEIKVLEQLQGGLQKSSSQSEEDKKSEDGSGDDNNVQNGGDNDGSQDGSQDDPDDPADPDD